MNARAEEFDLLERAAEALEHSSAEHAAFRQIRGLAARSEVLRGEIARMIASSPRLEAAFRLQQTLDLPFNLSLSKSS